MARFLIEIQALLIEIELVPFLCVAESGTGPKVDVVKRPVAGEGSVRSVLVTELRPATESDSVAVFSEESAAGSSFAAAFAAGIQNVATRITAGTVENRIGRTAAFGVGTTIAAAPVATATHSGKLRRELLPCFCKNLFTLSTVIACRGAATVSGKCGAGRCHAADKSHPCKE